MCWNVEIARKVRKDKNYIQTKSDEDKIKINKIRVLVKHRVKEEK